MNRTLRKGIIAALGAVVRGSPVGRHRIYAALPARAQAWLRETRLPAPLRVAGPRGRQLTFADPSLSQVFQTYYWQGMHGFEPRTTAFVVGNAARYAWLCDIGAYIGHYSLLFGRVHPGAPVRAFEAHPVTAQVLRGVVAANGVDVEIVEAAVCETAGPVSFYVPARSLSALPPHSSLGDRFGTEPLTVRGVTLTEALEGLPDGPGLIKIDAEGADAGIIAGGRDVIARSKPDIVFEVHSPPQADYRRIEEAIGPLGYSCRFLHGGAVSLGAPIPADAMPYARHSGGARGEVLASARP